MEMICNITRNDETKLANALRSIYSSVVINESFKDQSAFLQSVILLVDDDIKYGQSLREVNPTLSYRISTTHELAAAFIRKYQNVIDKAGKLAYSANERYGYTVDIASVVGPYILYQCGITDENLSFYIALGMTLSNIICDILAKHEEKNIEQLETEQMANVCKATYHLLKKTQKRNQLHKVHDPQIEKSIVETSKLLEELTKK